MELAGKSARTLTTCSNFHIIMSTEFFFSSKTVVVPTSKDVIVTNATMDSSTSPIANHAVAALKVPRSRSATKPTKLVSARRKFKEFHVTVALMERTICRRQILRDVPNVSALERRPDAIVHISDRLMSVC